MLLLLLLACEAPVPAAVSGPTSVPLVAQAPAPAPQVSPAPVVDSAEVRPEPEVTAEPILVPRAPLPADRLPKIVDLPAPSHASYPEIVAGIEAARRRFAVEGTHAQARAYLLGAMTERIIPAWEGTHWAFYGTAEAPGTGEWVACGYWVASVLRDAGLRIDRNHVGKQASEKILLTVAEPKRLRHFGDRPIPEVIAHVERAGAGIWGVGLANHAGLLWNDGTEVKFCHSDYHGSQGPRCELASASWALRTSYTVIAPLLDDPTLDAWFEGRKLRTGRFAEALTAR